MILRFLFYAFLIYLFYKLLVDFIIPVYKTTRRIKKGFREMNERMGQQPGPFQQGRQAQKPEGEQKKAGDYIDFEEVRD